LNHLTRPCAMTRTFLRGKPRFSRIPVTEGVTPRNSRANKNAARTGSSRGVCLALVSRTSYQALSQPEPRRSVAHAGPQVNRSGSTVRRTPQAEGGATRSRTSDAHDPAHLRRYAMDRTAVDELPDQKDVGRVHQKEDRGIERNRLGRQFAHGHPRGGERIGRSRRCADLPFPAACRLPVARIG
jgi:hypothetical protein